MYNQLELLLITSGKNKWQQYNKEMVMIKQQHERAVDSV
jgi:vancomycin permeability regulator SanA